MDAKLRERIRHRLTPAAADLPVAHGIAVLTLEPGQWLDSARA